ADLRLAAQVHVGVVHLALAPGDDHIVACRGALVGAVLHAPGAGGNQPRAALREDVLAAVPAPGADAVAVGVAAAHGEDVAVGVDVAVAIRLARVRELATALTHAEEVAPVLDRRAVRLAGGP